MLPDMARYSTSRPDTQETAAYAASQPLFDVLAGAISRLGEQKLLLDVAKTTVQHIHVKVPQEHVENNGTLPADYKDSLIAAWKSTTESYVRIFEQLCELTGPDPAAGKEADESFVGFQKLLYTAEAARTVAFERHAAIKRKADTLSDDDSSADSTATPNKRVKRTPAEVESTKRTSELESSPSQHNSERPLKRQRATTEPEQADNASGKTDNSTSINTVQRLKPKQIRKARKRRNQQTPQQQQQGAAQPAATTIIEPQQVDPSKFPQVQYEDISAELDARLRLREESKKSKKEAKKRKRESHGSAVLEAEPGAEREAMEARDRALAQKPAKKKSKGGNGEAVRSDGTAEKDFLPKGKRANDDGHGQVALEEDTGMRRSKRKKTK
ncbi:hypothetical protein Q7P37_002167 [Cladosporium fusiforme]